jgi:hypothetical protein
MQTIHPLVHEEVKAITRLLPLPSKAFLTMKYHTNKKVELEMPEVLKKYKVLSYSKYQIMKLDSETDPVTYEDLVTIIDNNTDQLLELSIHAKEFVFDCDLLSRTLSYRGPDSDHYLKEWNALGINFREITFKSNH